MPDTNPYEPPSLQSDLANRGAIEDRDLEQKAKGIGNVAEMSILVGIAPLLGIIFIPHLCQWYMLRSKVKGNQMIDKGIRNKFSRGIVFLWISVLLWPALVLILIGYWRYVF